MAHGDDREAPGASYAPGAGSGGTFEEELKKLEREQSEVVDLEQRERELEELQKRARELAGELWSARAAQRRRSAEAALPVIHPREPCGGAWEDMKGSNRVRACGKCKQSVYDLSGLAPDDARKLLTDKEGRLPTHVVGRVDGTVTGAHCAEKTAHMSPLALGLAAFGAAGLLMTGMGVGYFIPKDDPHPPIVEVSIPKSVLAAQKGEMSEAKPPAPPDPPPKPATVPDDDRNDRDRDKADRESADERAERRDRERHHRHRCRGGGLWFFLGEGPSCDGDVDDDVDEDMF